MLNEAANSGSPVNGAGSGAIANDQYLWNE
jgi:hypothetical protein